LGILEARNLRSLFCVLYCGGRLVIHRSNVAERPLGRRTQTVCGACLLGGCYIRSLSYKRMVGK